MAKTLSIGMNLYGMNGQNGASQVGRLFIDVIHCINDDRYLLLPADT